ncbi:MAG TPA: hypothetical protein VHV58_08065 [Pseudolabrys sp.]|jgi:hypothetical protein|nr:hypothetical protein [Pseudolabrys sp.]
MAALLRENRAEDNGGLMEIEAVHPALHSWRDDIPTAFVRGLAILCGLAVLSVFSAWIFRSPKVIRAITPVHRSEWIAIERPFPAFTLSIPEATDVPASYAVRRHAAGGGREDILSLGEITGAAPFLEVEIYRPGSEIKQFGDPASEIAARTSEFSPGTVVREQDALDSKFGPMTIGAFDIGGDAPRHCLAFMRVYDDPRLRLSGRFCQGGTDYVARSTLACALDRLSLLSAGSEPKIGALFAKAELHRAFCGERNPLLMPTPAHRALWGKIAQH